MSPSTDSPPVRAVVAIMADEAINFMPTLEAVLAQVYVPSAVYLVGGEGSAVADGGDVNWKSSVNSLLVDLDSSVSHIWMLAAGSVPRPDALKALVSESVRVDAAVAGSKLLALDRPDVLVSVGIATDVFGVPYMGLDEGEIDHGQHDVVRDVAAVAGQSVLFRRDLARGLGGLDGSLAPEAAAIDFSQRARILGARVVVVPSSEVAVPPSVRSEWREEAGRVAAMLKSYSWITLIWALPARFLIGIVDALLAVFAGRWLFFAWARSWLAVLLRLPSTLTMRRSARAVAVAGDAELFRYQVSGSAALRATGTRIAEVARSRFPSDHRPDLRPWVEELRQPAAGAAVVTVLFAVLATRNLWAGFPAVNRSLPLPESSGDAIASFAGGWNPAGFGSSDAVPSFVGFAGLWQRVFFDLPNLASGSLALVAFLVGIWGMTRLLRTWSISPMPAMAAGLVYMAGPAAHAIADSGQVSPLVGMALVPWLIRLGLAAAPVGWASWAGRFLGAGWLGSVLAYISPEILLIPLIAVVASVAMGVRTVSRYQTVGVIAAGTAIGAATLSPWLGRSDIVQFFGAGGAFWQPDALILVCIAVATLVVVLLGPPQLWQLGLWGGLLVAGGAVVARMVSLGGGYRIEAAGLVGVALGSGVIVAVALSADFSTHLAGRVRVVNGIGALAAGVLVVSSVFVLLPGRGGLPADRLSDELRFTNASVDDGGSSRVLLIGPADSLPGDSRSVQGAAYRVISAPMPDLRETDLGDAGDGDLKLASLLEAMIAGETSRAGAGLADLGIRWVVTMGETPLSSKFDGHLDVIPLYGLSGRAFLVDDPLAVRALADNRVWTREETGYGGESSTQVLVRENPNPGWGTNLAGDDEWGMVLSGVDGHVRFEPQAWGSSLLVLVAILMMLGGSVVMREKEL